MAAEELRFTAPVKKEVNNETLGIVAAVQNGVLTRVEDIIEKEEWNVNKPDEQDVPLLHWASINNRQEIGQYLLGRGASVSAVGGILRENALHWATRQGHLAMIVLLVRHGADWTLQNKDGYTPLHIAAQFQLTSVCAYYLALGANCDIPNNAGKTPLMLAISKLNVPDPTRLFLSMGASVSARDNEGNTALHLSTKQCNGTIVNLLIENGADMYSYNNEGETSKQIAEHDHSNWILKVMKEKDKEERIIDVFTKRLPTLLLGGYPGLAMGLIGYIITCDLPYMLPVVYIIMVLLIQILLLRLCLSRNSENPLPIGIYFGITGWLYATLYYQLSPYYFDFLSAVLFMMIMLTHLYSLNKTWRGDPGFLGNDYENKRKDIIRLAESGKFDMSRFCTTCVVRRPVRSKHCSVCNRCVAKFDHHCPFVGNCIGATNHKWFILYLVTVTAQLIVYCLATYQYYSKVCYVPDSTWANTLYTAFSCSPWLSWFSSLALLFLLWVTALLVMQLNQIILMGVTTNEFYNVARYNYLQSDCVGCTKVHSPFSFGWKQNISDFIEYKLPCLPTPQRYNWFTVYSWGSVNTPRPQSPTSKLKRSVSLSSIV